MNSIDFIKNSFKKHKEKIFLIDASKKGAELTYQEMYDESVIIASYFRAQGLVKGDRVAIIMNNCIELVKLYFAALISGISVVPINPVFSQTQINFIIKNSRSKIAILTSEILSKIDVNILKKSNVRLFCIDKVEKEKSVSYLNFKEIKKDKDFKPFANIKDDDELVIIYTSGTTTEPKGVVHTYKSIIENERLFIKALDISTDSRFYNLLPMTYLGGYHNLLLLPFTAGGSVLIDKAFSADSILNFWKTIIKYDVNILWLVPSIIAMLMEIDRGKEGIEYCRNNIKKVIAGTAPLRTKLKEDFFNKYGKKILENFGLSETLFISTNRDGDKDCFSHVGKILEGIQIEIDFGSKLISRDNADGEILVKTPYIMQGYFNSNSGKPDELKLNKWFRTGDLGYIDNEGNLHITGRKKDLIIRGGINISPAAIEDVLFKHKLVSDCAVIGIFDKIMGEKIYAVMVLNSGASLKDIKREITGISKQYLSKIQIPEEFFQLNELPRNSSGKIQKNKLKAWVENKLSSKATDIKSQEVDISPDENHSMSYYKPSKVVSDIIQATSIRYNNIVYDLKRKGKEIIVLSLGEAFFDIPLFDFKDLPYPDIYHYSHSRGIFQLRQNIAKYFYSQYDVSFNPETEIIITAGSKVAIHMSLMAVLNQNDEVLIQEPAWVSYTEQVKLCYGVPVQIPYYKEVFEFEEYITNRTKVIIINNPNNPRGKVYTLEELSYLYMLAEKYNLFILSDEAYSDFLLNDNEFISIGNLDIEKKHLILCNSISKNYGISGWRLGYVISNEELINQILKINQHLITCPATILEYYISKYFFEIIKITKPQIKEVIVKRNKVAELMDKIGLKYLPGNATFYFFVSLGNSGLSSEEFCMKMLMEEYISIVPGIGYGKSCDKFFRLSIGTESLEKIEYALNKIKKLIDRTS